MDGMVKREQDQRKLFFGSGLSLSLWFLLNNLLFQQQKF